MPYGPLRRGADVDDTWSSQGSWIGACRYSTGTRPGLRRRCARCLTRATSSLCWRRTPVSIIATISGKLCVGQTSNRQDHRRATTIAAAYRAWGWRVKRLEGDFAFILWDRREHLLVGARDLHGGRPLFFSQVGDQLVVGSCLTAMLAYPRIPRDINRAALACSLISAASTLVEETEFRAVSRVPAGCMVRWSPGRTPVVQRFAEAPQFERLDDVGPQEAAERLREVLGQAVRERLASSGVSSVWMSGGYDSPAIFALGRTNRGVGQELLPVSMSYPVGDKGREDELIERVAGHYGAPVEWVARASLPPLPDPAEWARRRDQCAAHPYENWNRALMAGTRRLGARIALSGNGGDQFFGVSGIFLGDLLRRGHWVSLWRELRALGFGPKGLRPLFHWAVKPNLPPYLLEVARRLRGGRHLKQHLQRSAPAWLGGGPALAADVQARQWKFSNRRPGESLASAEAAWYLHTSAGQQIVSLVGEFSLGGGVESRSPMYDGRVLDLMSRRPREDRYSMAENKRLLRQALAGLLPAEHLAPRSNRTGLPGGYLVDELPAVLPEWFDRLGSDMRLADLGLVQPRELRQSLDRYLRNPPWESSEGVAVFDVLSAEYWLRSHP
ncbi:MAG: asparagine synthase-related protein [Gemmatimonadales bacterium]